MREVQLPEEQVSSDEAERNMLWHRPLGHLTADGIRQDVSYECCTDGPQKKDLQNVDDCVGCVRSKMNHRSSKELKNSRLADGLLRLIYIDLCGSLLIKSIGQ